MPTDAYLTLLNLDNELRLTNYGLNVTYHVDGCSFNATSLEQWVAVNQLWVTLDDNFLSRPLGTYEMNESTWSVCILHIFIHTHFI